MSTPVQTEIDSRFSSESATALPWSAGEQILDTARIYWLSTVRSDGRPHVTPLIAIWLNGAMHFCTGDSEQKARNLSSNNHCVLTTGNNDDSSGLDIVLEGVAIRVTDLTVLQQLVDRYQQKYGWTFAVGEGGLTGEGGLAVVFAVSPAVVFGFGKGEPFSQTRWKF